MTARPSNTASDRTGTRRSRPPFDHIALLLQGGGALGAYQAGVYQALDEAGVVPDWVAGISIGAINCAIIAGNAPETRQKEIQFSSRTRTTLERVHQAQTMRNATAGLLAQLPEEYRRSPEARLLSRESHRRVYNIIHMIYRARQFEGNAKDYEFSRLSMHEHWQAGHDDAVRTLLDPRVLERPTNVEGVFAFELGRDGSR